MPPGRAFYNSKSVATTFWRPSPTGQPEKSTARSTSWDPGRHKRLVRRGAAPCDLLRCTCVIQIGLSNKGGEYGRLYIYLGVALTKASSNCGGRARGCPGCPAPRAARGCVRGLRTRYPIKVVSVSGFGDSCRPQVSTSRRAAEAPRPRALTLKFTAARHQ